MQVNVAFWSPDSDKDSPPTVLAAEHSSHAPRGAQRKQENENWVHVLQVVGCEVGPGKDQSVADMAWFVYGHPMTVWLAVAWSGGQLGVVDFSKGPDSPVWLWEQQVTVETISAFHCSLTVSCTPAASSGGARRAILCSRTSCGMNMLGSLGSRTRN